MYHNSGYNATQIQATDGHSLAKARDKASSGYNIRVPSQSEFNQAKPIVDKNISANSEPDILDYILRRLYDR